MGVIAQHYYSGAYLSVEQPLLPCTECYLLPGVSSRFFTSAPTLICSVGKAPMPTRVVYAFTTPYTSPTCCGGTPSPVHTPPTVQLDEVTKGYVPAEKHSSTALGQQREETTLTSLYQFKEGFRFKAKLEHQPKKEENYFYYVSFFLYNFHRGLHTKEKFKSISILPPLGTGSIMWCFCCVKLFSMFCVWQKLFPLHSWRAWCKGHSLALPILYTSGSEYLPQIV